MRKVIIGLFSLLLFFSLPAWSQDRRCAGVDYNNLKEALIHLRKDGGRSVYVKRIWYTMNIDQKENVARYLATCKSEGRWVVIYDAYTGKKLVRYSSSWGFSNYER